MSKIYTKTGDNGDTGLFGGTRVPKHHPRVAAYGEVDELNCAVGLALSLLDAGQPFNTVRESLARVQEELFVVGTLLATPADKLSSLGSPFDKGIPPGAAQRLEKEIDSWTTVLFPLKNFILPGGSPAGAALHAARAVCRRAERAVTALSGVDAAPEGVVVYLNRLSDHLFTAARLANDKAGREETPWKGLR